MPSRGITIKRMNYNDASFNEAKAGDVDHQKGVAMAFRNRVKKDFGFDPGYIEYHRLRFTALAAVPARP